MSIEFVPVKTGFRGRTMKVPVDSGILHEPSRVRVGNIAHVNDGRMVTTCISSSKQKSRRSCIGGRGREWGPACFRLLEEMSKMNDSQILMQPVDAIKHPEYYMMVKDPIDLSKIQLKFHNGQYQSMFSFVDDVHLVFSNHLLLYDDPYDQTHQNIQKIKIWFDGEIEKIKEKWFCYGHSGTLSRESRSLLLPREIGDRIDALEAENRSIVGSPLISVLPHATSEGSSTRSSSVKSQISSKNTSFSLKPASKTNSNLPMVLTKFSSTIALRRAPAKATRPLYAIQFSKASSGQKIIIAPPSSSSASGPSEGTPKNGPLFMVPQVATHMNGSVDSGTSDPSLTLEGRARGNSALGRGEYGMLGRVVEVSSNSHPTNPGGNLGGEDAVLHITNMWLGATQVTPVKPVVICDNGVLLNFRLNPATKTRAGIQRGTSLEFLIRPNDLVRCYTYLNNPQKHTIFLVVLPNCIRRLRATVQEKLGRSYDESFLSSFVDSCLIAMFAPAMNRSQVSRLMYSMWSMGKSSMFSSNLYTEIDQRAALSLLSNVKQTLLSTRPFTAKSSGTPLHTSVDNTPNSMAGEVREQISPEMVNCSVVLEKLDFENVGESSSDGTRTDDQSDAGTVSHQVQQQRQVQQTTSEAEELEEESLDSVPMKEEPLEEVITLNDPKESLVYVYNESLQAVDHGREGKEDGLVSGAKVRYVPGILSRTGKRKTPPTANAAPPSFKKAKEEEEVDQGSSKIPLERDPDPMPGNIVIHSSEIGEDGVIMEMEDIYTDENKDVEIVIPNDSDIDINDLEIKVLDQSEEGELIWAGQEINVKCPITQKTMKDPVRNVICGHTYDKIGVEELIKNRGQKARCPVPGCHNVQHLELNHLEPDETIKQMIMDK